MKLNLTLATIVALFTITLGQVSAAPTAAADTSTTAPAKTTASTKTKFAGTIQAVDTAASTITVENKSKGVRVFTVTATTEITENGKSVTLADAKVGEHVSGSYTLSADKKMVATKLTIGSKKTKAAATTPAAK